MTWQNMGMTETALNRLGAYQRGELAMPQWIIDWEKKITAATESLAAAISQRLVTEQERMYRLQVISQMKQRMEILYSIWLNEKPFKTWEMLAAERPPSAGDLFRYTAEDTEDYDTGPGVSSFVLYLDQRWKGFLKDFTHQCLRECDPLLEEGMKLTPEIRYLLSNPAEAFKTTNPEVLEARLGRWLNGTMPKAAPEYVRRLLLANVLVALGKDMDACVQMEFARCEAATPNFAELMARKDPQSHIFLTQAQRWQIDVLLSLWPS